MAADSDKALILGEHIYEGISYWNFCLDSSIENFKNFDVRSDDVFLVSYPKSGTHWIMEMSGLILNDGYPDRIDRTLYSSALSMVDMSQKLPSTIAEELANPPDMTPILEKARTAPSPRIMHVHLRHRYLPPDLPKRAKVIYVIRNPKDAFNSRYNVNKGGLRDVDMPYWEKLLQDFMTGDIVWGSWADHVIEYWQKWHDDENVLFMIYEEMKKDPEKSIRQIAKHLGRPLSDELFQRVAEHSSFSGMRRSHGQTNGQNGDFASGGGRFKFLNKGTSAQWKKRFTVAQNEAFDKWYKEKMSRIGLQLSFE